MNEDDDVDLLSVPGVGQHPDPAAQAFARLQGEIALMRRAVEQLAAERADIILPDYSATLGKIVVSLGEVAGDMADMAKSPALKITPESLASRMDAAAQAARASDHAAQIEARERLDKATAELRQVVATARSADEQRRRLAFGSGGALLAGILLWSFLPGMIARSVPESWQWPQRMAARVIRAPIGEAGAQMLHSANPQQWSDIIAAYRLWRDNDEAIAQCRKRAVDKTDAVRCTIQIEHESMVKSNR